MNAPQRQAARRGQSITFPGRRRQQRFVGAIFWLRPDNSLAGPETLEGGFIEGCTLTQPRRYSEVVWLK